MRQYDNADKDDRIQRTLDRMALLRKIDEAASLRKKSLQAKSALTISPVDDPQEKEADAVAKKVVSGGDAKAEMNSSSVKVQMKEEDGMLMAKSEDGALAGTEQLQTTLDSSKGRGAPLDTKTQNEIGGKMGTDLNGVKIHTDSKAHEMSEGINAKAFTHGQDIYFRQGNFDTNSNEGKELLAHELTHTVQQKDGFSREVQKQDDDGFLTEDKMPHKIRLLEGYTESGKTNLYIPKEWGDVWSIIVRDVNKKPVEKAITYGDAKDYVDLRYQPKGTYFVSIFTTKNPHKDRLETIIHKVFHDNDTITKRPENLQSDIFRGDSQLEKAYASVYGTFKSGSAGTYVRRVQYALIQLGYYVGEDKDDGIFGEQTERAVISFQEDYFLKPDGEVGPDALYQLDRLSHKIIIPPDFDVTLTDKRIKILGKVTGQSEFVDSQGYITAKINGKTVGTSIAVKAPEVLNMIGQPLPETILSDHLVDLRSLGQGVYFIRLTPVEDIEPIAIKIIKTEDATITLDTDDKDAKKSGLTDRLKEINIINQVARISATADDYEYVKTKGVNGHINPAPNEPMEVLKAPLLYNSQVHVIGSYKSDSNWLLVQNKSQETTWISSIYVKYPLPSGDSNLHFIQPGEQLMKLVQSTYGADCDFVMYSAAVVAVNKNSEAFNWDQSRLSSSIWDVAYGVLSGDMQYEAQKDIFQSVELKTGYNIWLPSQTLVKALRAGGTVVSSNKLTRLMEIAEYATLFIAGLIVGVFIGIWKGIVELISGIASLVQLIAEAAWAYLTGDTVFFMKLWAGIIQAISDFPEMIAKELEEFADMSAWDKGITVGTIIGMVIFEILLAIFTAGIVTAIKWTGKFAKLVRILRAAPNVDDALKKVDVDPPDKSVSDDINKQLDESENKNDFEKSDSKTKIERSPEEYDNLAKDPARGNKIDTKSIREREIGLALEEKGTLKPPIKRDGTGAAEFIDGDGTFWDIKAFNSNYVPEKGGFEINTVLKQIKGEIKAGENVIIDTKDLSPEHLNLLKQEVITNGLSEKVVYYP
jgi:peptidoglycan hydrolase-like protein with peptidoglycan-binding domain